MDPEAAVTDLQPLLLFFDCEAAAGNVFRHDIIEVAVKCQPDLHPTAEFDSLIHTDQRIGSFGQENGLTARVLEGQPTFPEVLDQLLAWCSSVVEQVNTLTNCNHYPVLVAHGGELFDFLMLFSHCERHNVPIDKLREHNIHFADTFIHLDEVKQAGHKLLDGCPLSLDFLLNEWFPGEFTEGRHRAMVDVQLLIKVFYETPLHQFLDTLPIFSTEEWYEFYQTKKEIQKDKREFGDKLLFLNEVERKFAVRSLVKNGLNYGGLKHLYQQCRSVEHFKQEMRDMMETNVKTLSIKKIADHFRCENLPQLGIIPYRPPTSMNQYQPACYHETDATGTHFRLRYGRKSSSRPSLQTQQTQEGSPPEAEEADPGSSSYPVGTSVSRGVTTAPRRVSPAARGRGRAKPLGTRTRDAGWVYNPLHKQVPVEFGNHDDGWLSDGDSAAYTPDDVLHVYVQDTRFNKGIDLHTGYKTLSILSMPLRDKDGEVIGVAQVVNKCGGYGQKTEAFNEHDEKIFESYMAFCGVRLHNASLYEQSQLEVRRNQVLLELSRLILAEQSSLSVIINKVLMHTQSLLQCQRCQVLLLDDTSKGMFSQVFECAASDFEDDNMSQEEFLNRESSTTNKSARFPINIKITSHVALTGETLNIPDAYKDERFDPSDEEGSENKTRCILCMPIRNSTRNIIGVMQLVNKVDDTIFSKHDENLFEAFAIFCGMGIHNTQMYEKVVKAMAKQRVALECLSYHAVASEEEADRLRKLPIPSSDCLHLLRWDFDDIGLEDEETLKASIRMFMDMDYLSKFSINYKSLCRWMLSVRKNYRNVTYHNWRHAFNVAQMMFTMLKTGSMEDLLDDIEGLALLLACLCHDLDHRGTNNSFQMKSNHPLAQLYGTSTMERHHFDQCIMILTSEGTELLSSMSKDDYAKCLDVMEHAILSTDLALYFKWRGGFFSIVDKNEADWSNKDNRKLLRSMMMTACDVAAITKPWPVQQRVAQLVASEFFEQGDLEKEQLKIQPMDMMNREKKDKLPEMQVDFIDAICMPVYKYLAKALPSLSPLLKGCEDNRQHWQTLADSRKERQDAEAAGKDAPEVDGIDGEDTGKVSSGEKNESLEEELATVGDSPSRIILETGEEERNGSGGCCPERPTCAS